MFSGVKMAPTTKPALQCPPNQFFLTHRNNNFYAKDGQQQQKHKALIFSIWIFSKWRQLASTKTYIFLPDFYFLGKLHCHSSFHSVRSGSILYGSGHLADRLSDVHLYSTFLFLMQCSLAFLHFIIFTLIWVSGHLADRLCGARRLALEYGQPQFSPTLSHSTLNIAHCILQKTHCTL